MTRPAIVLFQSASLLTTIFALAMSAPAASAQIPPIEENTLDLGLLADPGDLIIFTGSSP